MSDSLLVSLEGLVAGTVTRARGGRLRFDYERRVPSRGRPARRCRCRCRPRFGRIPTRSYDRGCGVCCPTTMPSCAGGLANSTSRLPLLSRCWRRRSAMTVLARFASLAGATWPVMARPGDIAWLGTTTSRAPTGAARGLHRLARPVVHRPVQSRGRPGQDRAAVRGWSLGCPSGSAATSHILKPAVSGLDDHDLNEHLCLDAARRAGLIVARTRIAQFGDESAIVVERYDRRGP